MTALSKMVESVTHLFAPPMTRAEEERLRAKAKESQAALKRELKVLRALGDSMKREGEEEEG